MAVVLTAMPAHLTIEDHVMRTKPSPFIVTALAAACGSHAGADVASDAGPGLGASSSGAGEEDAASGGSSSGAGSGGGAGSTGGHVDDASTGTRGADSASDDGSPGPFSDGPSCTASASSTAGLPGYVGDWTPGDYPSNFSGGNYLTISGVAGQMGNARQYAVH